MSDIQDEILNELSKIEEQQEDHEGTESYGSPSPEKKDSTLIFFRELIKSNDTKKFGNLKPEELHAVRTNIQIAHFAESQNLDSRFVNYFNMKAENTLATSLSKTGFFAQLFVTDIKKEQKIKPVSDYAKKRGWMGFGKDKSEGDTNEV